MKRHPKPLWDRQGQLVFIREPQFKASPLKNSLPLRSTAHSRKTVQSGGRSKRI